MSALDMARWDEATVAGWEAARQKAAEWAAEEGEPAPEWLIEDWAWMFAQKFLAEMRG